MLVTRSGRARTEMSECMHLVETHRLRRRRHRSLSSTACAQSYHKNPRRKLKLHGASTMWSGVKSRVQAPRRADATASSPTCLG